ncbi:hypothetical protein ACFWHG_29510 [Streptomyces microflavus]|uniref:hypothetical protein n=1 Tax=Streptomyces microflavus TaxID=1919 RepID=UPI00365B45C7
MQESTHGPALAYSASLSLRIGSAIFVACPDDRLQAEYYQVDAGVRSVWRHLRGSAVSPELVRAAEKANRSLWEQAADLAVPVEFVAGFRDLAAASLAQLSGSQALSHEEASARAVASAGVLEEGMESAAGAQDFERSCQTATNSMLEGWADDPLSTVKRIRRETDVWALAYQRFVRPELGQYHG